MLHVKFQDKVVNPQRPEAPEKTFSSQDVPHGTDSVIYKAAKILLQNHPGLPITLPFFKPEEIQAMIEAKKSEITVSQVLKDEQPTSEYEIKHGDKVFVKIDLSTPDMLDKIDELMGKEPVRSKLQPGEEQKQKASDPMLSGATTFCSTEQEAKEKILAEYKHNVAKSIVEKRIEECLDVPQLSDEFKAQFETFEA